MVENEKKFYIRDEDVVTKTVVFVKRDKVVPILKEEFEQEEKIGEITYTLKIPNWELKNHIRSISTTTNMIGISSVDPYMMNERIIEYLLKSWSIETHELKFDKDSADRDKIENVKALINSDLCDYIFDAVILIYNKFIS